MRTKWIWFLGLWLAVLWTPHSGAEGTEAAVGSVLPAIRLPAPTDPAQRNYLGLAGAETFTLDQIQAEVLIVQIYSMYCPICQREAPKVNQLFSAIERKADLRRRIKVIGIGTGNSPYEVDFYRQSYQVPFPLFADAEFHIHQQLGQVRTPYFIAIGLAAGKAAVVKVTHAGPFESADQFLKEIIARTKIQ